MTREAQQSTGSGHNRIIEASAAAGSVTDVHLSSTTSTAAKLALSSTEERLRRAQELGGAFPYEWDLRSNVLIAPVGFGSLYGLTPSEAVTYDAVVARIQPDDRIRASIVHRQAVQAGGPYEQEYRVIHPNGKVRWLLVRGEATRDEHGAPLGLAGVAMDITARKEAELALLEREQELAERNRFIRNVLSSSDDCIKVLDLDANLRFMSEGGMRVMEVDDFSKIEGCSWPAFWAGEAAEEARAAVDAARSGGSGRFVGFCPTLAGTPRWWDVAVTPILDEEGTPGQILSISRDITQRRQAEEALKQSRERLEVALAAGNVGTWVWDIPTSTISADERLAQMFEIDLTEAAKGAPVEAYVAAVHPDDRDRVAQIMADVVERGGKHDVEIRLLRSDGSIRWVAARGECQFDSQGRPSRFPAATVDITDLKRAEEARELVSRELAHRIKNIFSVVNGLISLSARGDPAARPFAESLRERLTALAQAHDYVRPHGPESHRAEREKQTVLGLVKALLAPYLQEGRQRVLIEGDDAAIGPHSATALALVIHEQATNAMKYGSLSNATGTVSLRCELSNGNYSLLWQEVGGPPVLAAPRRRGFGTELASRSINSQLGGTISQEWAHDGLIMRLDFPADRLCR
jgi:PAS domain S-box-containing protein